MGHEASSPLPPIYNVHNQVIFSLFVDIFRHGLKGIGDTWSSSDVPTTFVVLHSNYNKCYGSTICYIFSCLQRFCIKQLSWGPNIGFAGCEMRVKMKAENGMTELLMAEYGITFRWEQGLLRIFRGGKFHITDVTRRNCDSCKAERDKHSNRGRMARLSEKMVAWCGIEKTYAGPS